MYGGILMKNSRILNTKDMVLIGLMIALIWVAGSIIKVPTLGGFIHIGDCMVFLSVIILGKKKGSVASAVGMFLVDALGGYYLWAPFTFIIKGIMAYIAGLILEKMGKNTYIIRHVTAFVISGVFMVIGYFAAGIIMAGFLAEKVGFLQGVIFSAKDIIGNIIQVTTGIIIALPLAAVVGRAKSIAFTN